MREDKLWEAAMTAIYGDTLPVLTASERRKIGKLLNELREIQATPEDLLARARQYPKIMPAGCILTLAGLVNNWGRCSAPKRKEVKTDIYRAPTGRVTPEGYKAAIELLPASVQRRLKEKRGGEN